MDRPEGLLSSDVSQTSVCICHTALVLPRLETLEKEKFQLQEHVKNLESQVAHQNVAIRQLSQLKTTVEQLTIHLNNVLSGFSRLDQAGIRREADRRRLLREKLTTPLERDRSSSTELEPAIVSPTSPPPMMALGLPPTITDVTLVVEPDGPAIMPSPLGSTGLGLWVAKDGRERSKSSPIEIPIQSERSGVLSAGGSPSGGSPVTGSPTSAKSSSIILPKEKEDGEWRVTTWAGNSFAGHKDGACRFSSFKQPYGIAVDAKGNLYIADRGNFRLRKVTAAGQPGAMGVVSTISGLSTSGSVDGPVDKASFYAPTGVAVDGLGNLYIADNDRIRRIGSTGMVTTLVDGSTEGAIFHGVAVDNKGRVFFTDKKSHRVFKITAPPKRRVTILAGTGVAGFRDGPADRSYFNSPSGIAVDNQSGDVYVADYGNHRIRRISRSAKSVATVAGGGTKGDHDGVGLAASFTFPSGLALHPEGVVSGGTMDGSQNLFVVDESHRLRKIDLLTNEVSTIAGTGVSGFKDGVGATFNYPRGIALDRNGTVWISDTYNHRVRRVMYWSLIDGDVL